MINLEFNLTFIEALEKCLLENKKAVGEDFIQGVYFKKYDDWSVVALYRDEVNQGSPVLTLNVIQQKYRIMD